MKPATMRWKVTADRKGAVLLDDYGVHRAAVRKSKHFTAVLLHDKQGVTEFEGQAMRFYGCYPSLQGALIAAVSAVNYCITNGKYPVMN